MKPKLAERIARFNERHGYLDRKQFWETLSDEEKEFFEQLGEAFGPLTFEYARKLDS